MGRAHTQRWRGGEIVLNDVSIKTFNESETTICYASHSPADSCFLHIDNETTSYPGEGGGRQRTNVFDHKLETVVTFAQ